MTRRDDDKGAALVMVLGIMMVGAVILSTLVVVTVNNSRVTAHTREEMAVLASADGGIDIVRGLIEGKTHSELASVCAAIAAPYIINNDEVLITTAYRVTHLGGSQEDVNCPAAGDVVQSLTVTSVATSAVVPATGQAIRRTVVANFATTPPSATLSKAVFSEASLLLQNTTEIMESSPGAADANVYSNGSVTIQAQVGVDGEVYAATGDITVDNLAELHGTLWAAGRAVIKTGATVYGDVYAASAATGTGQDTAAVWLGSGNSKVTGSVLTNGSVYSEGKATNGGGIGGIVLSSKSTVELNNDATVGGSVYAKGNIIASKATIGGDALSQTGSIFSQNKWANIAGYAKAGTTITNVQAASITENTVTSSFPTGSAINPSTISFQGVVGYPTTITAPQRAGFPMIGMSPADILLWTNSGWTVDATDQCAGDAPGDFINNSHGIVGRRLIIFTCASNLPVNLNGANTHDITLNQDTALVSDTGFDQSNEIAYHGVGNPDYWTLYWIVPSTALKVTWVEQVGTDPKQYKPDCSAMTGDEGKIILDKMKIDGLKWFVYTPCTFLLKNGNNLTGGTIPLTGQVYAGQVTIPTGTNLEMEPIPVPSLAGAAATTSDPAALRMSSRFDLRDGNTIP
jgi:predicted acyltransferase (DUF342 family)